MQGMFGLRKNQIRIIVAFVSQLWIPETPWSGLNAKLIKDIAVALMLTTIIDKIATTYALLDVRMSKDNDLMIDCIY